MRQMLLFAACFIGVFPAYAQVETRAIQYQDGEAQLEGFIAQEADLAEGAPAVLVVHEWKGLNAYAQRRAEQLAEMGYIAFAVDMYGKGVRAKDHEEAAQLSGAYRKDRQLMRRRILAALETLRLQPMVDPQRIAAIGYCFGGTTVLELARSGADVLGVASFHGGLDTPNPQDAKQIKARVLVLHGADDKFISQEQVRTFDQEMKQGNADFELIQYPGAVHSFTVPEAGDDPSSGMAYQPQADAASWAELTRFLQEIFSEPRSMRAKTIEGPAAKKI